MTAAIKAAHDRYHVVATALQEAASDLARAIADYRAAHPAPTGKFWSERGGEMVLYDVPENCTHVDFCGFGCDESAVEWDDAGNAWCEEHKGER